MHVSFLVQIFVVCVAYGACPALLNNCVLVLIVLQGLGNGLWQNKSFTFPICIFWWETTKVSHMTVVNNSSSRHGNGRSLHNPSGFPFATCIYILIFYSLMEWWEKIYFVWLILLSWKIALVQFHCMRFVLSLIRVSGMC